MWLPPSPPPLFTQHPPSPAAQHAQQARPRRAARRARGPGSGLGAPAMGDSWEDEPDLRPGFGPGPSALSAAAPAFNFNAAASAFTPGGVVPPPPPARAPAAPPGPPSFAASPVADAGGEAAADAAARREDADGAVQSGEASPGPPAYHSYAEANGNVPGIRL